MTSEIDATKPAGPNAYTADMRANFQAAADEISALQAAMAAPPPWLPLDGSQQMTGGLQINSGDLYLYNVAGGPAFVQFRDNSTTNGGPWSYEMGQRDPNGGGSFTLRQINQVLDIFGFDPRQGVLSLAAPVLVNIATDTAATGLSGEVDIYSGDSPAGSSGMVWLGTGLAIGAGNQSGDIELQTGGTDGVATRGSITLDAPAVNVPNIQTTDPGVYGSIWADPAAGFALKVSQG